MLGQRKKRWNGFLGLDLHDRLQSAVGEAEEEFGEDAAMYRRPSQGAIVDAALRRIFAELDAGELTYTELLLGSEE